MLNKKTIAVVGLGYVGLPLAVEFGKKYKTIGYDISATKVAAYQEYRDSTGEVSAEEFKAATKLTCTTDPCHLASADFIIIAMPTPVDDAHQPDFAPLISASETVGKYIRRGAIIIFESTVYPGATEEICIPILEKSSGLRWKHDFFVGYSPERINPGDKQLTVTRIVKVVSGDTEKTLKLVSDLYESIVVSGVYKASSIKVAEAAKVVENTQRDINIAFVNELAIIFDKIGIDTSEVLAAAGTKWNFLKLKPGLVGGHCIGVDPYYLTFKAEKIGYHPDMIIAGRRINDGMSIFIAQKTVKIMIQNGVDLRNVRVYILGLTFKENCADLRNSKVPDIIRELESYAIDVQVHDPIADRTEAKHEYGLELVSWDEMREADAVIVAVSHGAYAKFGPGGISSKLKPGGLLVDVKAMFSSSDFPNTTNYWRL